MKDIKENYGKYLNENLLNLENQQISDENLDSLIEFLNIYPEITKLNLSENPLINPSKLLDLKYITQLNLSKTYINEEFIIKVIQLKIIEKIIIDECDLDSYKIASIANKLEASKIISSNKNRFFQNQKININEINEVNVQNLKKL